MSRDTMFLIVVLGIGAVVRFHGLGNEPFWTDEMHTITRSGVAYTEPPPAWSVRDLTAVTQGPLFMLVVHVWSRCLGVGEVALRALPALFGLLTVPALWPLARRLLTPVAAGAAVLLLALSPFHVWYSRELRGYTLVILAAVWSTTALLSLIERRSGGRSIRAPLLAYLAGVLVGLGASFTAVFMLAVHGVILLLYRRDLRPSRTAGWAAVGVVCVIGALSWPWVDTVLDRFDWGRVVGRQRSTEVLRSAPAFQGTSLPYTFYVFAAGFSLGPSLAELHATVPGSLLRRHAGAFVVVALAFGGGALVGLRRMWRGARRVLWVLLAWVVVPLGLAALLAVFEVKPWNPRYVAVSLPAFVMLVAAGVTAVKGRWVWLGILLVVSVVAVVNLLGNDRYWKEDYRSAARYLDAAWRTDDVLVAEGAPEPLFYYLRARPSSYVHVQTHRYPWSEARRRLEPVVGQAPRIWLVRARAWQADPERVRRYLGDLGASTGQIQFRGITIEGFERPGPRTGPEPG